MSKKTIVKVILKTSFILGKSLIMKQEQVTFYSNDGTLVLGNGKQR